MARNGAIFGHYFFTHLELIDFVKARKVQTCTLYWYGSGSLDKCVNLFLNHASKIGSFSCAC